MSNLKSVIKSFYTTPFYNEWLLALKDSPELFSIDNIKPCLRIDNEHVQFVPWDGLDILSIYKAKKQDDRIDAFIIELLGKSIDKYKSDTTEKEIDKLNANFPVIDKLMSIALSKALYVENIDFISFLDIYLDSCFLHSYSLFNYIKDDFNEFSKLEPDLIYNIILLIKNSNKIKGYELKYLFNNNISSLIQKNPVPYYSLAYERIINDDLKCYDMGAFIDYKSSGFYCDNDLIFCFYLLKESSKTISELKLKNDVITLIESDNEYHKRIGLALINNNFEKINYLFYDNIHLFFNESTYYLDLCSLLANHLIPNIDIIINELNIATFGCNNKDNLNTLKNRINIILSSKGYKTTIIPETKKMNEFINNFNRHFYMSDFDIDGEADNLVHDIEILSIDEALEEYNKRKNSSYVFTDVLNKAYIKYFEIKKIDISKIFNKLEFSLITEIINEYKTEILKFYEYMKLAIDLMNDKSDYSIISFFLYNIDFLINKEKIKEAYYLISKVDLNMLDMSEIEEYDVTHCINHIFCVYCENYSKIAYTFEQSKSNYLKMIKNSLKKNTHTIKGIIAMQLPLIKYLDESIFSSIVDFVLDNKVNEINFSYYMMGYSGYFNIGNIIDYIKKRDDFKDFFLNQTLKIKDLGGVETIIHYLLSDYLTSNDLEIISIIFNSKNYKLIYNGLKNSLYFFNSDNKKMEEFIKRFINYAKQNEIDSFDAEQIIRSFAGSIIKSQNNYDYLWEGIIVLFKYFNNYISEELIELLKIYKDSEYEKVSKIVDLFIEKYNKNIIFNDTLTEMLNIFKNDNRYRDKMKEWVVSLTKKNEDLDYLIPIYVK